MTHIERLQEAIKDLHKCDSRHLGTVRVRETLPSRDPWEGFVEIFFLINHPEAKEAYAWIDKVDKASTAEANCVIFLGIPPIESFSDAVRAFLSSEAGYRRAPNPMM
jgi:hypothetical protein